MLSSLPNIFAVLLSLHLLLLVRIIRQVLLTCIAANSLDIMTATTLSIAFSITKALSTMHPTCMFVIVLDAAAPVTSLSTVTSCKNRCRVKRNTGH